ncbi:MAG: Rieske (2Fe-2S) protein [Nitrospinota bacterium]
MPNFVRVASLGDFPVGEGRIVIAARKPVAVFNVDGALFAVNNICPHMGGPIGSGKLNGTVVTCPYHHMRFDVRTGESTDGFRHPLQTYPVKVEGDDVFIDAWWAKEKA